jgi:hypothetical protein
VDTVVSCQGKVAEKLTIARQSLSLPQHQGMSHVLDLNSHATFKNCKFGFPAPEGTVASFQKKKKKKGRL